MTKHYSRQQGQTIVETLLAAFILVTSLIAGLTLAIYAINATKVSRDQVVATNLAREGLDVIRMMRDSNWLLAEPDPGSIDPTTADDLQTCAALGGRWCYPRVSDGPFRDLNAGNYPSFTNASYRALFNPATRAWTLDNSSAYDLYIQSDKSFGHNPNGSSDYARQIKINFLPITDGSCSAPCNHRFIQVKSIVAWRGKTCTEFGAQDLEALATPCKTVIEEQLTNWKDYK